MSKLQVWPSPLGFLQLRNPFAFPLQCEPDVEFLTLKGRSHSGDPSASGEGAYQKEQLATQPRPLSPAPLTPASQASPWHPLHLPSPPTGNDIGQISEVHMSWTVSLGIFWASSLLYVSYPFHSRLFFFFNRKNETGKETERPSSLRASLPTRGLGQVVYLCLRELVDSVCYSL